MTSVLSVLTTGNPPDNNKKRKKKRIAHVVCIIHLRARNVLRISYVFSFTGIAYFFFLYVTQAGRAYTGKALCGKRTYASLLNTYV